MAATTSCGNDWLNTEPSTSIPSGDALNTYFDLVTAQNGMYDGLQEDKTYYGARMLYYGDVRADDMQATAASKRTYALYEMNYTVENAPEMWLAPYNVIRRANNIIKAIESGQIKDGAEASKNDILGQAYAVRALVYFDLCRIYGAPYHLSNGESLGVPLVLTPVEYNHTAPRATLKACYEQIIKDLEKGISLMGSAKQIGYFNSWAGKALLARVYLYQHDYAKAYTLATDVITSSPYKLWSNTEYVEAWAKGGNSELLFEIVNKGTDDWVDREAIGYLLSERGYDDFIITKAFYDQINKNPNDVRLGLFVKPTELDKNKKKLINNVDVAGKNVYIKKFPGRSDFSPQDVRVNNIPVLRLSDIYLVAAEAAALGGGPAERGAFYANRIIKRADATTTDTLTAGTINLDRILEERRLELVGEGHRFFDLMRNDKTVTRYTGESDKGWHCNIPLTANSHSFTNTFTRAILPIPKAEMDANTAMKGQQNPGY